MGTTDRFSWADSDDVVVPSQLAIAVYENTDGNIVIRQERDLYEEEDTVIIVNRGAALHGLVEALRGLAEDDGAGDTVNG